MPTGGTAQPLLNLWRVRRPEGAPGRRKRVSQYLQSRARTCDCVRRHQQRVVHPGGDHWRPDRLTGSMPPVGARRLPKDVGLAADRSPSAVAGDVGRRIVFSISQQRVWLVSSGTQVASTYLVSGSLTNNLQPGTYSVYSRSRNAVGIDDSGTMEYFVRFTRGDNAAIGFHTIPVLDGQPLQTEAQLGTPQSHGCIRQRTDDAIRLWEFAPLGTRVVVTP